MSRTTYPISGNLTLGDGIPVSTGQKIIKSKGITVTLEGATFDDIINGVNNLGKLPTSSITGPVRKAATKTKKLARMFAPCRSGALRKGIVVRPKKERTRQKGKVVYDIWMDPGMTDIFVRNTRAGKRYFYPGSMEYGFRTKFGKEPGHYFMKTAVEVMEPVYEQFVIDDTNRKLDAQWEKKQAASSTYK